MRDIDIEGIFKQASEHSVVAGLRMIYNLGYCDGAGTTPNVNTVDKSTEAAKPPEASVAALKSKLKGVVK